MKRFEPFQRVMLLVLTTALVMATVACQPSNNAAISKRHLEFDNDPNPSAPIVQADEEPAVERNAALVTFAGDCTFSSVQGMSDFNNYYDSEGPAYFFGGVQEIFANDDYTVINLEGPVTTSTAQTEKPDPPNFWFKSPLEYVAIMTEGSVEACNLANNHTLDYGHDGLYETEDVLTSAGIDYFLYDETLVKDINGIKIGFFGFAFDSNADNIHTAIDSLWAQGAEVIVAYFHDGVELDYHPNGSQVSAAHSAIDYGASAVIMSHPHVIQGTEDYHGGFIAYSLGNFCFGGNTNPADKDSMIVQLEFERHADGISCTPTVIPCSITSSPGLNDYRPLLLRGEEAQRELEKIAELSD